MKLLNFPREPTSIVKPVSSVISGSIAYAGLTVLISANVTDL